MERETESATRRINTRDTRNSVYLLVPGATLLKDFLIGTICYDSKAFYADRPNKSQHARLDVLACQLKYKGEPVSW